MMSPTRGVFAGNGSRLKPETIPIDGSPITFGGDAAPEATRTSEQRAAANRQTRIFIVSSSRRPSRRRRPAPTHEGNGDLDGGEWRFRVVDLHEGPVGPGPFMRSSVRSGCGRVRGCELRQDEARDRLRTLRRVDVALRGGD